MRKAEFFFSLLSCSFEAEWKLLRKKGERLAILPSRGYSLTSLDPHPLVDSPGNGFYIIYSGPLEVWSNSDRVGDLRAMLSISLRTRLVDTKR